MEDNRTDMNPDGEYHKSFINPDGESNKTSSDSQAENPKPGNPKPGAPKSGNRNTMKKKSLKSSKLAKKAAPLLVLLAVAGLAAGDCTYQIQEQEQAVLTTLGVPKSVPETGLHFKLPLVQKVYKVNTTIQGFSIGYDQYTNNTLEREGVMITSDYNFINVDFFLEYRIADPVKYLYNSEEPEYILKNISQSCIRTVIASYSVDDVLTTGKSEIQAKIKDMILRKLDSQDVGIQLVNITIQDSEPPTQEVMKAFKAVETAKQGKETALNNANKYRNEQLPLAEAEADEIMQAAEANKQVRINEAEAEVAKFNAMYEEYSKNPVITKQRMFYETMEDVLPRLKVIVDDGSGMEKILPIDSFMENTETVSADKPAAEE